MWEILNNANFGVFATIFGLIALLGGAAGYFKSSRGDSIIKYQTIEINNLRTKVADQDKEIARLTQASASKDVTIEEQKKHITYLQKLAQGSPQLKKLTTAIENQTKLIGEFFMKRGNKNAA